MNINGKVALVTGAGSGIGRATALMLADAGAARVIAADINEDSALETARQIAGRGAEGVAQQVDVADLGSLQRLFAAAEAAGGLDILLNNAGIVTGSPQFPDTSVQRIAQLVAINLTAVMVGTKLAFGMMRRRGTPGVIVNTASRAAFNPSVEDPAYCASKAGVLMFTQSCREMKQRFGIRVNTVCPAITDTAMLSATGGSAAAQWMENRMRGVRVLTPEDIGRAVLALIEDEEKSGDYILVDNVAA